MRCLSIKKISSENMREIGILATKLLDYLIKEESEPARRA